MFGAQEVVCTCCTELCSRAAKRGRNCYLGLKRMEALSSGQGCFWDVIGAKNGGMATFV